MSFLDLRPEVFPVLAGDVDGPHLLGGLEPFARVLVVLDALVAQPHGLEGGGAPDVPLYLRRRESASIVEIDHSRPIGVHDAYAGFSFVEEFHEEDVLPIGGEDGITDVAVGQLLQMVRSTVRFWGWGWRSLLPCRQTGREYHLWGRTR